MSKPMLFKNITVTYTKQKPPERNVTQCINEYEIFNEKIQFA